MFAKSRYLWQRVSIAAVAVGGHDVLLQLVPENYYRAKNSAADADDLDCLEARGGWA